jgi:lauroyl/myristoyl acyltransferase
MSKTGIFRLAFRWLPHVPLPLVRGVASVAACGAWAANARVRRRVQANLAHIPTLAANPPALRRATYLAFQNLFQNYVDLFVPPPPGSEEKVAGSHLGAFRAVQAEKRGIIFLTLHSSGFEWGRHVLGALMPDGLVAPVETVTPPEYFDLLAVERGRSGIRLLPITAGTTLREMITVLRQKHNVLIAMDRDVQGTGMVMPFFGRPARIPTGAIALARSTGAALVLGGVWRDRGNYTSTFTVFPADLVSQETRGDDAIRHALQPIVAAMEREIMARPDQWLAAFIEDIWLPAAAPVGEETAGNIHSQVGR